MKTGLVSVVIPIFNDCRFLAEAISSVSAQSYALHETIIVDDGSKNSDEIYEIVKSFLSDNVRYIRNEKNIGLAASRNVGMKLAQGEFICFLDADDIFAKEKLAIQVGELNDDPALSLVFSDEYILGSEYHPTRFYSELMKGHETILNLYACQNFIAVFTVMIRSSIIQEVGYFNESLRAWEDNDFWFRIMLKGKVKFSDYPSGYRRLHDANMSSDRHAMNFYAIKTFSGWVALCEACGNVALKKIIKARALSYFKVYTHRALKTGRFNIQSVRLILLTFFY